MEEINSEYVKRTQKDYSISFKLSVVSEIERGDISITSTKKKYRVQGDRTITNWLRKYGAFNWVNQMPSNMQKCKDQKILELEQKIKLLEKQKNYWRSKQKPQKRKRSSLI